RKEGRPQGILPPAVLGVGVASGGFFFLRKEAKKGRSASRRVGFTLVTSAFASFLEKKAARRAYALTLFPGPGAVREESGRSAAVSRWEEAGPPTPRDEKKEGENIKEARTRSPETAARDFIARVPGANNWK